jgi:hypothetical protein
MFFLFYRMKLLSLFGLFLLTTTFVYADPPLLHPTPKLDATTTTLDYQDKTR